MTNIVNVDRIKLASQLEQLVIDRMYQDLEDWADQLGMRQMFVQDAADGLAVCELLAKGRWKQAENRLSEMDTAARDVLREMLDQVAGQEFFDVVRDLST